MKIISFTFLISFFCCHAKVTIACLAPISKRKQPERKEKGLLKLLSLGTFNEPTFIVVKNKKLMADEVIMKKR